MPVHKCFFSYLKFIFLSLDLYAENQSINYEIVKDNAFVIPLYTGVSIIFRKKFQKIFLYIFISS